MKIEISQIGGAEKFKVVACPPQDPKPAEVRVRHRAIGVNFIDIYLREGRYPVPLPAVLGVEGAGVIEAVGAEVSGLKVGDVVAYAGVPGAYATTRLLPARRAIKLSPAIAPELAAATLLRGLTVHMLLTRTFPVRGGETLLVHAAAGGLGGSVTRWAKRLGCTVIGTVGSEQKAAIARAAGADHVIVGRDADFVGEVAAITDGAGVDFAVDGIGGAVLSKTLACVRRFGTVASMGQTAGAIPPLALDELGPARSLSLARPSVMAYSAEPETYTAACEAVLSALSEGVLPGTFSRYKLEDVAQAHRDLELGATTGSLILVP